MKREGNRAADGGGSVYIVAGEASGDLHAANLARALRALRPDIEIRGLGGPRLAAAGAALSMDLTAFTVMGIKRVLPLLGRFVGVVRRFHRDLVSRPPRAVVLIDYPGLNFVLASLARRLGIPVVYYVCPQLWAWAPWRVKKLRRRANLLLVIFPFEERFFGGGAARVAYVGHPLCDELARMDREAVRREVREQLGVGPEQTLVGLFPGSRRQEVAGLAATLGAAAARLAERRTDLAFAFSSLEDAYRGLIPASPRWQVVPGPGEPLMAAVDAALVASGTASLELAYFGKPLCVVYPSPRWQQRCFAAIRTTPFIASVNLLAGEELVPERLVTGPAEAPAIAAALEPFLPGGSDRDRCRAGLEEVARRWLVPGASERAAAHILEICEGAMPS